jgi:hypothetical protein
VVSEKKKKKKNKNRKQSCSEMEAVQYFPGCTMGLQARIIE